MQRFEGAMPNEAPTAPGTGRRTKALCFVLGILLAPVTHAGEPEAPAGTPPTEAQAREVVVQELRKTAHDTRDVERVRIFSGPHLVTGINFARGLEQAWLLCTVVSDGRIAARGLTLKMRPFLMRNTNAGLELVSQPNWSASSAKC